SASLEALPARPMLVRSLPVAFIVALFALSFLPRIAGVPLLALSFRCACGVLSIWYLIVVARSRADPAALGVDLQIIRVHWVQMLVHSTIYTYWGWFWAFIYGQVPLLIGQICFAYGF